MTDVLMSPPENPAENPAERPGEATRPRVLVVGPRAQARGGIGSVQHVLERHLPAHADLAVVTTHADGPDRLRTMLRGTLAAARRIRRDRPDVVHLHVSQRASVLRKGLLGVVARRAGARVVMHLHGSQFLDWFDALPRPARAVVRGLLRPHTLVVLSETLRAPYRERLGVPADRIVALPNPVEWPAEPTAPVVGTAVTALFLGRFGARKGIYDLVDAVARLTPGQRARLRLVAAGDGEVEQVREAVATAGVDDVVEVVAWLDRAERDALLARAQLLVLPSSHEGLPMAVLEAMAFGVAPVVTPVGALPELVRDGVNGALVPVGDPAALARALGDLLDDDERRLALGARARVDAEAYAAPRWAARLAAVWAPPR